MIYITKVHLENFQSHKKTSLEFDRGLNVILGNSDSGKTAILRAIKWALYNEPQGDYFIMQGQNQVLVEIEFSNGAIIKRLKSSSKNDYYLKLPNQEEQKFEAFGRSVPQEIINITGMYKMSLNDDKTSILNIADQLEGPFLLNQVPSVRASAIGRLISVNYIDDALRDTVRQNKTVNTNIRNLEKSKTELEEEIAKFDYLKDLEKKYEELKSIRDEISIKEDKLKLYKKLSYSFKEIDNEINSINIDISKLPDLELLSSIVTELVTLNFKNNYYINFNDKLNKLDMSIKNANLYLNNFKDFSSLEDIKDKLNECVTDFNRLNAINLEYMNLSNEITEKSNFVNSLVSFLNVDYTYNELNDKLELLNNLKNLLVSNNNIDSAISKGEIYLNKFNNLDVLQSVVNKLLTKKELLSKLDDACKRYQLLENALHKEEDFIKESDKNIKIISKDYSDIISKAGICPFCFNTITDDSMKHINRHLLED